MHKTLDEVEEKDVSLKDVTEEGTLPGEKAKRGGVSGFSKGHGESVWKCDPGLALGSFGVTCTPNLRH